MKILYWLKLHTVSTFSGIEKLIKNFDFMSQDFEKYSILHERVINFVHEKLITDEITLDDVLILLNCIPKGREEQNFPSFKTYLEVELGDKINNSYIIELLSIDDYESGVDRIQYIAERTGGYMTRQKYVIVALEALMRISDKDYNEVASDIENTNHYVIDNEKFWKELKERASDPWPQLHYLHLIY